MSIMESMLEEENRDQSVEHISEPEGEMSDEEEAMPSTRTRKRRRANGVEKEVEENELVETSNMPKVLYAQGSGEPIMVTKGDAYVLGDLYTDSKGYKFFQDKKSGMIDILVALLDPAVLELYANDDLCFKFQGTAYSVVKVRDAHKALAFQYLRDDGNGGWKLSRVAVAPITRAITVDLDGITLTLTHYMRTYYRSSLADGFKKIVSYLVPDENSKANALNYAVIQYYWTDGIPKKFDCRKQRNSLRPAPVDPEDAVTEPQEMQDDVSGFRFGLQPSLEKIRKMQEKFSSERGWNSFHTPRNLVLAMVGEVGEVAELFQWKGEVQDGLPDWDVQERQDLEHELADVLIYLVRLADKCHVDLPKAVERKIQLNSVKYPVEQVYGSSKKYTEYAKN